MRTVTVLTLPTEIVLLLTLLICLSVCVNPHILRVVIWVENCMGGTNIPNMDLPGEITIWYIFPFLTVLPIASAQQAGPDNILPVAVAGSVAVLLFFALVSICGILLYRRFTKNVKKKRKPAILAVATQVDTDVTTLRSSTQPTRAYSNGGSNISTDKQPKKKDYWTRLERRGVETEDKIRRMNIADEYDEPGAETPVHSPPPPILRAVAFDMADKSSTARKSRTHGSKSSDMNSLPKDSTSRKQSDSSSHKRDSSQYTQVIYHRSESSADNPADQPSSFTDLGPPFAPLSQPPDGKYVERTADTDVGPPFTPNSQSSDSVFPEADPVSFMNPTHDYFHKDDDDEDDDDDDGIIMSNASVQPPKPYSFETPDEDGFYRVEVK